MLRIYWMLRDMCSAKLVIYQWKVAPNCFKSYKNSWCPDFFQNNNGLSNAQSEIHLVRRNIVSTGLYVRALKKIIFKLPFNTISSVKQNINYHFIQKLYRITLASAKKKPLETIIYCKIKQKIYIPHTVLT